jgi:phosphoribosyl 1,2-cyclic phosphate phosphodiesterase
MKVTVLGCGPAGGVPSIGNEWGACDPKNPRNRRTRVSVLIEEGDQTILIDTSPDMRQQLLDCNLQNLTAVLFTHAHADHCHGIDDLRAVNWLIRKPVDVYADPVTLKELEDRFTYVFHGVENGKFYKPTVTPHAVEKPFKLGNVRVTPFAQDHVTMTSLGLRLNDFAYSTDVKRLDDAAFEALKGVKVWVVDCVQEEPHPTHSHLAQTLEWIAKVKPERAYLTHMSKSLDYEALAAKCPKGVTPAYDGMVIEC